jgi:hypothetical protein
MFVFTEPASPEVEAEYNRWYDEQHLPEVCAWPGITAARRYKLNPGSPGAARSGEARSGEARSGEARYLAVYDLDSDDPRALLRDLQAAATDGRLHMSDALQVDPFPVVKLYDVWEG